MKISELIAKLENFLSEVGDVEVQWQNNPDEEGTITDTNIFVIAERYEGEKEYVVNIRNWPY